MNALVMLMSLTNSVPAAVPRGVSAASLAIADRAAATSAGVPTLLQGHKAWWLRFWSTSVLTIDDAVFESFHLIQLYKLGSATRCEGVEGTSSENCWAMDLAMPWYQPIGHWHDYHWDP